MLQGLHNFFCFQNVSSSHVRYQIFPSQIQDEHTETNVKPSLELCFFFAKNYSTLMTDISRELVCFSFLSWRNEISGRNDFCFSFRSFIRTCKAYFNVYKQFYPISKHDILQLPGRITKRVGESCKASV